MIDNLLQLIEEAMEQGDFKRFCTLARRELKRLRLHKKHGRGKVRSVFSMLRQLKELDQTKKDKKMYEMVRKAVKNGNDNNK